MYGKEKWPTRDLGENEDKGEEEYVEDIRRGKGTTSVKLNLRLNQEIS